MDPNYIFHMIWSILYVPFDMDHMIWTCEKAKRIRVEETLFGATSTIFSV